MLEANPNPHLLQDRNGDKKIIGEGNFAQIYLADWNGTPAAAAVVASDAPANRARRRRTKTMLEMEAWEAKMVMRKR